MDQRQIFWVLLFDHLILEAVQVVRKYNAAIAQRAPRKFQLDHMIGTAGDAA